MSNRHIRNPIKWHGDRPRDHFTMIPNELARANGLSPHAFQVAIVIRSHAEDYEVSIKSLAEMLCWQRETVSRAMADLVTARWLAIRRVRTAKGTPLSSSTT